MMEADELCDRVAIVNRGRIVAEGTPAELKQQVQQNAIVDLQLSPGRRLPDALRAVDGVVAASVLEQDGTDRFSLLLASDAALSGVMRIVESSSIPCCVPSQPHSSWSSSTASSAAADPKRPPTWPF